MTHVNFKVSIIIPAFNEQDNIFVLFEALSNVLNTYINYEIIFVDDGSTDSTLANIKSVSKIDEHVKYLSLSRNFGHQNALRAGLDFVSGDCVISMDADLQHPPDLINAMIEKWLDGYEVVYTVRDESDNTTFFKRKTANMYYNMINILSDVKIPKGTADFRLLDRSVVEVLKNFREANIFYRGIIPWIGFRQCGISYSPNERVHGQTKYSIHKMMSLALSGITALSVKPLRLSTIMGTIMSLLSFCYGSYAIIMKLLTEQAVSGWASMMTGIFFIGGIQLLTLGVIGEYIGRLFMQAKHRPNYIIKEKTV
jgi:polyisoprenyl-phosphate glycosyltransferase